MKILLTGATGFVGRYVYPALVAAGHRVVCASRDPRRARVAMPDREWIELDLDRPETIGPAMDDCDAAVYLVHQMNDGGRYPEREASAAAAFAESAVARGIKRLVFLGGVVPETHPSRHLLSRQRTGEILRAAHPDTIELRAAMIIGAGSTSWIMVRDLAARLPAMLLPRWLRNHSHPIAIDDVVRAILCAMALAAGESRVFELPGPERIAHRALLRRVAAHLGRQRLMLDVPVLTPRLSSYWIALVTRVDLAMARELVEGVRSDLDPRGQRLWDEVGLEPIELDTAIAIAIEDEAAAEVPSPGAVARSRAIAAELADASV